MYLENAQSRLSELMTMTILYSEELGTDAITNEAILAEAIANVASAADLTAFMADIENLVTHYSPEDDFDFDNTGVVVILDDGTEMSYDAYVEAGLEGGTEMSYDAYVEAGLEGGGEPDPVDDLAPVFEFINPLEARKPIIGVDEMCRMEA